jgi:hypothetical protein
MKQPFEIEEDHILHSAGISGACSECPIEQHCEELQPANASEEEIIAALSSFTSSFLIPVA